MEQVIKKATELTQFEQEIINSISFGFNSLVTLFVVWMVVALSISLFNSYSNRKYDKEELALHKKDILINKSNKKS